MAIPPLVAKWFKERRGITSDTLDSFGVTVSGSADNPLIGLHYKGAIKFRKGLEKDDRKFWWDPPSMHGQVLYTPPAYAQGDKMILVEGETDAMALWQHAPDEVKPFIRGLPGAESWKEAFLQDFQDAKIVYVILDNDDPYDNADGAASTDRGWQKISRALGKKARRVKLPQGTNDVCEFLMTYSWSALKELLDASTELELPYKRMDFSGEVPEFDWLVKDMFVQGDIVIMAGHAGTGKSFYTSALALAVLGVLPNWLDMPVLQQGPVLVVDQENPFTTVRTRMRGMGLMDNHPDLHYLWYQGVRLDTEPTRLIEYARLIEPKLIILDSISRIHFQNENAAEAMNPLLNGGVYPLSRELGATVIILHHLSKEGRTRGSTALTAAADLELRVRHELVDPKKPDEEDNWTGKQIISPNKLRNLPEWGSTLLCEIVKQQDGTGMPRRVDEPGMEGVC